MKRLFLACCALAALLATVAWGTDLGERTWVSAGPRGVQFTSDFRLAEVFRAGPDEAGFWPGFELAPDGSAIFALRQPPPHPQRKTELVRLRGVAAGTGLRAEPVLDLQALAARPDLWDPGVDISDVLVSAFPACGRGESLPRQSLAVAENGYVFLLVGAWPGESDVCAPPLGASLVVLHQDGSTSKVLTLRELIQAVGLDSDVAAPELGVAASGPGRLWVMVRAFPDPRDEYFGMYSFYEVVDPNGDGDWSDRVIRPFPVPTALPVAERGPQGGQKVYLLQMVAEPSAGAEDGAQSLLVTSLGRDGQYRIYRLVDRNGDADALDSEEFEVVLTANPGYGDVSPPTIAARLRELVAARLTRPTRISRISESGEVTDVGRAFERLEDVLAGPEGNIYAVNQVPGETGSTWVIYRLAPLAEGAKPEGLPVPSAPAASAAEPGPAGAPKIPRIAFTIESSGFSKGKIVVAGADGSDLRDLVKGDYNHGFCQSANGRRMAYFSEEVAPHEAFLYVANADGSRARKVTERQVGFWCGFSERWLLLTLQTGGAMTLIRHDLRNGRERTLVGNVDRLALSPDGNRIVFVGGLDFSGGLPPTGRETLELLDLDTGARRRLEGPLPEGRSFGGFGFGALDWSDDGRRILYTVGPPPYPRPGPPPGPGARRYDVYVRDVPGGRARRLVTFAFTRPPMLFWSPDGGHLLVCVPEHGAEATCQGGIPKAPRGRLLLLDVESGERRLVTTGRLYFAGWVPGEDAFSYADGRGLVVVSAGGEARRVAKAPARGWPAGTWFGWSPDGRYVGLGDFSARVAVLDARTGRIRVLYREPKDGSEFAFYRKWWRT